LDFQDKQYVIGIDLGTTNSAVSYVDLAALRQKKGNQGAGIKKPKVFQIPQLTGYGEFTKHPVLPSFLYIPGKYDISQEGLRHPWKKKQDLFAGCFARDHGAKIPSRLVCSAKSWLCNPQADRQAAILPWGAEGFDKISPVAATAEYLLHIKSAWNHSVKDEDRFLENQFVVITVPASFDEEAREFTMDAVRIAGFGNSVTLLEEPLAAFYSWLINHEKDWHTHIRPDDLVLVCDVGGGTTDFSLITLKESEGSPRFERIAVGDHLILGGDNIDLALARRVASKFRSGSQLSPDKWKTLCHSCRQAKEKILDKGQDSVRITLKGEGRSLIAGTLAADLTRSEVEDILLNQFYPFVDTRDALNSDSGKQVSDFGLLFEQDSAVTRHIIRFLENHRQDVKNSLSKDPLPDFILFNGGTLKPGFIQKRIQRVVGQWFGVGESHYPAILENKAPDLAVGIGASYYGLVKQGKGVRVGSGSPRSYYIGVKISGENTRKAVCVVERGLDEGSVIDLADMQYEVRANEPVSFEIFSSSFRSGDRAGTIIEIDKSVSAMSPVQTVIKFGKTGQAKNIPVTIGAEYTEMGTLSMYCKSAVSDHRWKLQFQLRQMHSALKGSETEIYDEDLIKQTLNLVETVFTDDSSGNESLKTIVRQIEKIIGQKKANWPLSFLRRIADKLLDIEKNRMFSPDHEARWLNLTGFCLRPGFGDAFDQERAGKVWKIYLAGLVFDKVQQNRLEWWIFIRRTAGGMKAGCQRQFFQDVSPVLVKNKSGRSKLSPREIFELWMAAGSMERLLVKDKIALAKALIPVFRPGKNQDSLFWVLSRLGARQLLYGSVDRVVPPQEVVKWINRMMKITWKKSDPVDHAISMMARKTGDRTRDIDHETAQRIVEWLTSRNAAGHLIRVINEKIDIVDKEKNAQFGEKLPSGFILKI